MKGIHYLYIFLIVVVNAGGVLLMKHYSKPKPVPFTSTYIKQDTPSKGYTSVYVEGATVPVVYKNETTVQFFYRMDNIRVREGIDGNDSNFSGLYDASTYFDEFNVEHNKS